MPPHPGPARHGTQMEHQRRMYQNWIGSLERAGLCPRERCHNIKMVWLLNNAFWRIKWWMSRHYNTYTCDTYSKSTRYSGITISLSKMYHSLCCCLQSQMSGGLEGHSMSDEQKHTHCCFDHHCPEDTLLWRVHTLQLTCLCSLLLLFRADTEIDRVCFGVMIAIYWETLLHCSTAAQEHFRNDQLTYKHIYMHKSKHI